MDSRRESSIEKLVGKMNRRLSFLVRVLLLCGVFSSVVVADSRPRIIVLTDITNEPDDQESLVRFLVYANEFEIEGLIATTSTWLRNRTSVKNIRDCVSAYGRVQGNLGQHLNPNTGGFPTVEHLESVIREGYPAFGMKGVGDDKDTAGSRHIIEVVDQEDERPVWVTAWGGANCLAQALHRVREERSPEELAKFVSKIRVYTISDQDDSGPWMRREFPKLFYVVSPGGERDAEYYQATWTGISGDEYYLNGPGHKIDLVSNQWLKENVRDNHGPLGAMYPKWEYIMEGDTPSYMNLINNGLGSHISPGYGGWGGRYALKQTYADAGKIWQNTRDRVQTPDGQIHFTNTATIWRWREAFQHDFAARMDWCVKSKDEANHNPVVVIDDDKSKDVLTRNVKPGDKIRLSAAGSSDPDGDELKYHWFHYSEAERDLLNVRQQKSAELTGADSAEVTVTVPAKPPRGTRNLHIILDVKDNGTPSLHAYRRVILKMED